MTRVRENGEGIALLKGEDEDRGWRIPRPRSAVGAWDAMKDGPDAQFEVRAFTAGGYEDPVTGSLNAGLAQWLIGSGVAPSSYVASQGLVLGRMGRVHVERDGSETWIGGAVTTCVAGTLTL